MVHVAVNKYDFEKINILEYAFGEGGGGHQKAYAVYAFINVDNCERPLIGPVGKKLNKKKIKITGSIIGPAMAGPTGPFATALQSHCKLRHIPSVLPILVLMPHDKSNFGNMK